MARPIKNLTGERFGKLTVISMSENTYYRGRVWICRCDCGEYREVAGCHLHNGRISQCKLCAEKKKQASYKRTSVKRGDVKSDRLHGIWQTMKSRCNNPNMQKYPSYGGRGIKVCDEWNGRNGYFPFKKWALANGYNDSLTIERIDVNGDYCPENCIWIPNKNQGYNKRNTLYITFEGVRISIARMAYEMDIDYEQLKNYLQQKAR